MMIGTRFLPPYFFHNCTDCSHFDGSFLALEAILDPLLDSCVHLLTGQEVLRIDIHFLRNTFTVSQKYSSSKKKIKNLFVL